MTTAFCKGFTAPGFDKFVAKCQRNTGKKSTNKNDPMASEDHRERQMTSGSRSIAQPPKRIEKARI